MMKFSTLWVSALLLFSLTACSIKTYEQSAPKLITFKTKKIKYHDLGFIRNTGDALQMELFTAGVPVFRADINHLICTKEGCISKSKFHDEHFEDDYNKNFFQEVILGKPIFDKKAYVKTKEGFEQIFKLEGQYNIIYRVRQDQIYFKDRHNKILIKIQSVDNGH